MVFIELAMEGMCRLHSDSVKKVPMAPSEIMCTIGILGIW